MSRFAKNCNKATMTMQKFATKQLWQCQNLQQSNDGNAKICNQRQKCQKFAAAATAWVHKEKQQAAGARNDNN